MEYLLFIVGGLLLYVGAEALVAGASDLARRFGVSSIVIGLTIVAYGTSLPEFVVSASAALGGNGGVAMGNVLGSNICNIALILGSAACMHPLKLHRRLADREIPFLIVVSVVLCGFIWNGLVGRIEGMLLFATGLAFTWASFRSLEDTVSPLGEDEVQVSKAGMAQDTVKIFIGLAALFFGGNWFVEGAVEIARDFGLSENVIGLTLVAFGTSIPELVTVIVAIKNGEHDIGVGNLIGSNVFNLTIVLGGTAAIAPVPFAGGTTWNSVALSLGLPLLLVPLFKKDLLSRKTGLILISIYVIYNAMQFVLG